MRTFDDERILEQTISTERVYELVCEVLRRSR